jgi:phosphoribosyl-ATP pyrophosphohydrolase/phosphoribosyl-AMP cyclohydrolase
MSRELIADGLEPVFDPASLDFAKGGGTVTVVAQDAATGTVLMVAAADRAALEQTLSTGEMHYLSRTRGPWRKGATSGNVQRVVALQADCDGDAVLALVEPAGPSCHTGSPSCFGELRADALTELDAVIRDRATAALGHPPSAVGYERSAEGREPRAESREPPTAVSYTARLLCDRNLRLKKLGEECAELVAACADGDRERAVSEVADLYYHMMVALRALDAGLDDVKLVLESRQ